MTSPTVTHDDVERLATYVSERTGINFRGAAGSWLREALRSVSDRHGLVPACLPRTEDDDVFWDLCDRVTVQESYFFREPAKLEIFTSHVLPQLSRSGREIRAWSAGCARGEEAYTLSMLLTSAGMAGRYRVVGTDLSPTAVDQAARGTYGQWALRGVDAARLEQGFLRQGAGYRVRDHFREAVTFHRHNLLEPLPSSVAPFDVVFCRNVLIYFSQDAVRRVAETLAAAIVPGGWLITSASDPILEDVPGLEPVVTEHGLAYRRVSSPGEAALRSCQKPNTGVAALPRAGADGTAADRPLRGMRRARPVRPPEQGRPDRAQSRPAISTEPGLVLGDARRALEIANPQEALRLAAELLDGAHQTAAHRIIVEALVQEGRLLDAAQAAALAVGTAPEDPAAHHLHAVVLLECDRLPEAKGASRRAIYLDPKLPEAHLALARVHERMGDHQGAARSRRNWQRLLQEAQRDAG